MTKKYRCRKDFVLFRFVDKGKSSGGVHIPEIAEQGKQRVIVAIGKDVDDLFIGDEVLVIGAIGENVIPLPDEKDLFMTRENNVALVITKE